MGGGAWGGRGGGRGGAVGGGWGWWCLLPHKWESPLGRRKAWEGGGDSEGEWERQKRVGGRPTLTSRPALSLCILED